LLQASGDFSESAEKLNRREIKGIDMVYSNIAEKEQS